MYRGNLQVFLAPTTNALFLGDPVIRIAASAVDSTSGWGVYQKVDLVTAGTNHAITGAVVGFLGSNPNGAFLGFGLGQGPFYKATNKATQYVLVDTDPNSTYTVQCTGTPAATVVGKNINLISGTGSTTTGWSGWQASATTATTSTWQLRVLGFLPEVTNIVGNKFPKLVVAINNSTELNQGLTGI
jgi:hypothetical protein